MVMVSTPASVRLPINGNPTLFPQHCSPTILKWRFRGDKDGSLISHRTKAYAFRILTNVSETEDSTPDEVMVDPLEAKRLAAKQMQQIKAEDRFKYCFGGDKDELRVTLEEVYWISWPDIYLLSSTFS